MSSDEISPTDIAVVGYSGRFPGARDVESFWENLRSGVESIRRLSEEELREAGVPESRISDPDYVPALAQLEDADRFDADFFGFTPREAAIMDPQHRHFLECAWEALETAGYDTARCEERIGVYGGVARNTYLLHVLRHDPGFLDRIDEWEGLIGGERDFPATRVAYKLDLKGPAINVQTACSTSAVATHLAAQSLLTGECDIALAGGGRVQAPLDHGYVYEEGSIVSPDGHCRAFDEDARGTIRGSGVAMVVLKRLTDAVADGDTVHAVIRGTAVNNDGSDKVGFTAPSVRGQADAIAEALSVADVAADTIGYVEAHGTGTAVGDPIEITALTRAFGETTDRTGYCPIGSVKSNIGHLDAGAGVAGLLKTVMALREGEIPPSLHYESANPQIDFENSPFFVNTELREWERDEDGPPRRAGVSSFGLGGTNAHIVLEEAPELPETGASRPYQLLTLSARTPGALDRAESRLAEYLGDPKAPLHDVAYTLHVGRREMSHRSAVVCASPEEGASALRGGTGSAGMAAEAGAGRVAFMFPGQGAQHVNMGLGLYRTEPVFREAVDRCARLVEPHIGFDLLEALYPPEGDEEAAGERLRRTEVTQPAVFAVEYALAELWRSWGVEPAAMIGHSLGEYVAACRAGVFGLEEALRLVSVRGRLMEETPPGAMASVPLSEEEVAARIGSDLSLAGVNAPGFCVVSGTEPAVDELVERLESEGHECTRLHVSRAFHSSLMDDALEPFMEEVRRADPSEPRMPFVSNVTGDWIEPDQATDPEYWARHIRRAVRFGDGVERLAEDLEDAAMLEVGPGKTLSSLARLNPASGAASVITPTLGHPRDDTPDEAKALTAVGKLWTGGIEIDWQNFHRGDRRRVPLPTYPFERERHWIDVTAREGADEEEPAPATITSPTGEDGAGPEERDGDLPADERLERDVADILYSLSGIEPSELDFDATFLELGFESLTLTQVSRQVKQEYGLDVGLRDLMNSCRTPAALVEMVADETGLEFDEAEAPEEEAVRSDDGAEKEDLLPVDRSGPIELPLTDGQMEIWFAAGAGDAANCAYNLSNTVELRGDLDLGALEAAVRRLTERHSSLRSTFDPDGPTQRIPDSPEEPIDVPLVDLSDLDPDERKRRLAELRREEAETPFDLEVGPLFRPRVVRLAGDHHLLFLTVHHIVADGWSCGILSRDVAELYSARVEDREPELEEPAQFEEFVRAEIAAEESGEKERDEEYWLDVYSGDIPVVELPTDRRRPAQRSFRATRVERSLDPDLEPRLREAAAANDGTFFGFLQGGFEVLLQRLTGQEDLVVGITAAGQAMIGRENLVGHCVHLLPVRCGVRPESSVAEQLSDTTASLVEAFEHQGVTFGPLVGKLDIERDPSRMPLVSVVFNMNPTLSEVEFAGLDARAGSNPRSFEIFDLFFNVVTTSGDLRLECTFNRDILDASTVERWLGHYETLLEEAARDAGRRVVDLPMPEDERRRLVEERNRTERPLEGESVLDGIDERVRERSEQLAVEQAGSGLTYGELASRSDAVAAALTSRGVGRGDYVGICFERSPSMVVALLGVWKAGAAYLPLDPDFPAERLGFMLEDAGADLVLTDGVAEAVLPEDAATLIGLERALEEGEEAPAAAERPSRDDLAYVIYTSGSTGRPKGVEIEHGNLLNFIASMAEEPGLEESDVLLAVTTLSFDISTLELFLPLWVGARIEIAGEEEARDGRWLAERLEDSDATVMQATPATWRMLLDAGWSGGLRKVLCGGEAFPPELIVPLLERADEVWNLYGPTETTVWSTAARMDREAAGDTVSIGRPIANTRVHVMDDHGRLAPEGVPGELWIGGAGVGRGYHDRAELTAEKFVEDPFVEGGRAYRTGDLVRWMSDGRLEHLGRMDNQVKVNGFRIELGEIETALAEHSDVHQAVADVREGADGESRLVAYVVWEEGVQPLGSELRRHLRTTLPDYMIPGVVVDMDGLPLTPNGKVDRNELPNPLESIDTGEYVEPQNEMERRVAELWGELLDVDRVGRDDNFFELGGHSLLAVQAVTRMKERTGLRVDPRDMFFQTLEQVAANGDAVARQEA